MKLYQADPNLAFILRQYLDPKFLQWAEPELEKFGQLCGTEFDQRAVHTDRDGQPKLIKYDKYGEDISFVWLNEGYKKTIEQTYNAGIVGYLHKEIPTLGRRGNYLYSFAQGYLLSQVEPGFYCPVTLTMATAYLLDRYGSGELKAKFLPHIISTGDVELFEGATFLTERQGGSDVGANETKAEPFGDHYVLSGEKYFASNAGACGVAMVLGRIEGAQKGTKGLSLFLVPWRKEDGSLNGITIRRLKDKLGVRAVPSGEVVFHQAKAFLVGDASKGFSYMMEALNLSRICNTIASVGIMQRAYLEAKQYAFTRDAFGSKLKEYPMVQETLVNMRVKQEVETSASFALVDFYDKVIGQNQGTIEDQALLRLLIALLKAETAEQAIHFAHEAIEMHGGNGYIEDFVTPRLLRDAQVLTVWEGTANILGLEVLRLLTKFHIDQLFLKYIESEYDKLPLELQRLGFPMKVACEGLAKFVEQVKSASSVEQTYHCKKVAKLMTNIYESLVALQDAAIGGERKKIVARLFMKKTWQDSLSFDNEMLQLTYFNEIVDK
ncbi:isovaleryl-CoA dehydrogenase [Anaerobacillus alkaliphilus]|uniref:Isovaleryl-CoA dehydrogenase n=1 Tax=Anaerobacillus alkaliphilus TaxID=1548597 RepID=A0A4V1LGV0_9BACI|nr:acyl-CoA dehydrogenase family protein [Anaerobacillus alkaliphilus]RXJ04005.1 isovaleryl-CoA dehydrogenase [Anaerobacillus alkaliphilus]